jgi:hypothetical protein
LWLISVFGGMQPVANMPPFGPVYGGAAPAPDDGSQHHWHGAQMAGAAAAGFAGGRLWQKFS